MSGGSHGYIYSQIQDELCGQMHDAELNDLMKDVVELAHDLEWYDSSDISEESYKKTVTEFKKKWLHCLPDGYPLPVDAVPVIRCRECKHWHRDVPVRNLADNYGVCYRISSLTQVAYTTDDFYCAEGGEER